MSACRFCLRGGLLRGLSTRGFVVAFAAGAFIFVAVLSGVGLFLRQSARMAAPVSAGYESPWAGALPDDDASGEAKPLATREPLQLRVYFTANGRQLHAQTMDPRAAQQPGERMAFVLAQLLAGPVADFFLPTVPPGTLLRGAYMVNDTAVVDFGDQLRTAPRGGPMAEMLCVYAIVNTVIDNVPGVREVQILIDGKAADVLWDQVDISSPLRRDGSLIEQ